MMTPTSRGTLLDLAVFPTPPDSWIMAVFSAYFDESKSAPNISAHVNIMCVAGYVSRIGGWRTFEDRWREFLKKHEIEYLHMNELFAFRGQFARFQDQASLIALLKDAVSVIRCDTASLRTYDLKDVSCIVYVDHLQRINRELGVGLDPYAVAVAVCRYQLFLECSYPVEMIVDHFKGCSKKLRWSEEYLESYQRGGELCVERISAVPSRVPSKELPALQAADFAAWEMRRYFSERYHLGCRNGNRRYRKSLESLFAAQWHSISKRNIRLDYPQLMELAKVCDVSRLSRIRRTCSEYKRSC